MDVNIIAVATVLAIVAGVIAIAQAAWLLARRFLLPLEPPIAAKADIDALLHQISALEQNIAHPSEYLAGLPQALNETLRAAYQEARILQLEGYEAQNADKHKEAIDRFTRALGLAENDAQRAALHILRGNSYEATSDYHKAQNDYRRALQLSIDISPAEDAAHARATALRNLGTVYASLGQLQPAEESYQQALQIDRETGNRLGQAEDLGNLGTVHAQRGDLQRAEQFIRQALEIHQAIGNRLGEAAALSNLGIVYRHQADLNRAEQHYKEALQIQRQMNDRAGQARQLGNLGLVYARRGDLDRAEQHHKQAIEIHRQLDDRLGQAQDLANLGIVYAERGDLHQAKQYYKIALDMHRQIGSRLGEANALANLGRVAEEQGDLKQARELLGEALAIYEQSAAGGPGPQIIRRALARIEEQKRQQPQPPQE